MRRVLEIAIQPDHAADIVGMIARRQKSGTRRSHVRKRTVDLNACDVVPPGNRKVTQEGLVAAFVTPIDIVPKLPYSILLGFRPQAFAADERAQRRHDAETDGRHYYQHQYDHDDRHEQSRQPIAESVRPVDCKKTHRSFP